MNEGEGWTKGWTLTECRSLYIGQTELALTLHYAGAPNSMPINFKRTKTMLAAH